MITVVDCLNYCRKSGSVTFLSGGALVACLGWADVGLAAPQSFTEDFTSTLYRDADNTTAHWDTAVGEIKLFSLPRLTGSLSTPGGAGGVFVAGNYAYVTGGVEALQVIDIADPSNPAIVGSLGASGGFGGGVIIEGDYAYVTDTAGLLVVDISTPSAPSLLGSVATPGSPFGFAVEGDHAFVSDDSFGLQVIDVSDPSNPALVGSVDTPDFAQNVFVSGNIAYIADGFGLQVVDVTDPTAPIAIGSLSVGGFLLDIHVDGDHAYITDQAPFGLRVVDVSDPSAPILVGSLATGGIPWGVYVAGDRVCMGIGDDGLAVIDVSDPTNPVLESSFDTPDFAQNIFVAGEQAFVADGSGLQIVQVSGPQDPTPAGFAVSPGDRAFAVDVSGNYAYLAINDWGFSVFDISNPTLPTLVTTFDIACVARGIDVVGNVVYLSTSCGLYVFDVTDPTTPVLLTTAPTPESARWVEVSGDRAYVADLDGGLQVFDVSTPSAPVIVGSLPTDDFAEGLTVRGDRLYLADKSAGFKVIDVSDPSAPALLGSLARPGLMFCVTVAGDYAYVGGTSGLTVVDISDPTTPTAIADLNFGQVEGIAVAGDNAYVATIGTLRRVNISDPANPVVRGSSFAPLRDVVISGDYAYAAEDGADGALSVFRIAQSPPPAFELGRDRAQSVNVNDSGGGIVRVRLTTTQTDSVVWNLSNLGGAIWQPVVPDGFWLRLDNFGSDLRWRSRHAVADPAVNPAASELTLEWLNTFAPIFSIDDVPEDQGRQVRITWGQSGFDFVGDPQQIVEYSLYRRVDSATRAGESRVVDATSRSTVNPPGWDFVLTVPADAEEEYSVVAPTVVDSTATDGIRYSAFMVRARIAPGAFYDSPPDSGYSVDNLAPAAPLGLTFDGVDVLVWDESTEVDFAYHTVYGSDVDVLDETATPLDFTIEHSYDVTGSAFPFYHVTTTDFAGNEGDEASVARETTSTGPASTVPAAFALHAVRPNPFLGSTSITFDLPRAEIVRVSVFDAAGRRVRMLADGRWGAREHRLIWDGTTDDGHAVAAGVYFVRITAGAYEASRRLVRVR